jgi:hypothetical protein
MSWPGEEYEEKPYARPPMQSLAPPISSLAMLQNIEKIAREVQLFSSLLEGRNRARCCAGEVEEIDLVGRFNSFERIR